MSDQVEQFDTTDSDPVRGSQVAQPDDSTGHETVDAVVRSLDDLDDRPVQEHVTVFESAHERLRGALADAGDRPAGPGDR